MQSPRITEAAFSLLGGDVVAPSSPPSISPTSLDRVLSLMQKCTDVPMGLADACPVRTSEILADPSSSQPRPISVSIDARAVTLFPASHLLTFPPAPDMERAPSGRELLRRCRGASPTG